VDWLLTGCPALPQDLGGLNAKQRCGFRGWRGRPRVDHLPDDTVRIPEIVRRAQPGYRLECGECVVIPGRIAPETLFFR
jgi:hypothetical protein